MRIGVIGAGAIGGLLAARLAAAGLAVTVVERGEQLAAIRGRGLRLVGAGHPEVHVRVRAVSSPAEAGEQDLVVLGVKAHEIAVIAPHVGRMLAADGVVMTTQNGIPWWYFAKQPGEHLGRSLASVDPGGLVAAALPVERVIGCVVYPAAEVTEPGVIRLTEGNRLSLSEIDGAPTERIELVSQIFRRAGFKAPVVSAIRDEIWLKLLGSASFNPVSALTGATMAAVARHPSGRELVVALMQETRAVGERLGVVFPISNEHRIAGAEAAGDHRTSMLRDVEARRPTEADAILGAVREIGALVAVPTPTLDAVHRCMKLLEDGYRPDDA